MPEPIDVLLGILNDLHAVCHEHREPAAERLAECHKLVHRAMDIEPSGRRDGVKLREILLRSK